VISGLIVGWNVGVRKQENDVSPEILQAEVQKA
jgi:hypothetical protein